MYSGNLYIDIKLGPKTKVMIIDINIRNIFEKINIFLYVLFLISILLTRINGLKI